MLFSQLDWSWEQNSRWKCACVQSLVQMMPREAAGREALSLSFLLKKCQDFVAYLHWATAKSPSLLSLLSAHKEVVQWKSELNLFCLKAYLFLTVVSEWVYSMWWLLCYGHFGTHVQTSLSLLYALHLYMRHNMVIVCKATKSVHNLKIIHIALFSLKLLACSNEYGKQTLTELAKSMVSCVNSLVDKCSFTYSMQIVPGGVLFFFSCCSFVCILISLRLHAFAVVSSLGTEIAISYIRRDMDITDLIHSSDSAMSSCGE